MTELFLKVFRKKEYWKRKVEETHAIMLGAEFNWRKARRYHRRSSSLHIEYALARLNFEKACNEFHKAMGWL